MEDPNAPVLQADGTYRNATGQVCDEHGQIIALPPPAIIPLQQVGAGGNLPPNPYGVDRQAPGRVDRQDCRQQPVGAGNADNARTLAEYNRPDLFYANRSAIRLPTIQRNDFELKPAFYSLVGQHPFSGLPSEHPMDHIENFEDLASSIKANGVSSDYLHCKLFPHSLSGEASAWLKNLEPGSLTTWEETKNAFLCNFYDDARSEELRKKISTFSQGPAEAFKAAWVRFKSHQKACPHHGFSIVQLLGIFYRGIDWRHQMALDSASNGNFNTRYPDEALQLIENLSQANSTKNADLERKKLAGNDNAKEIAEVNAKIDMVANFLMGKKYEPEQQVGGEDVNYVDGAGFQGQRFRNQHENGGYNSTSFTRNYGDSSYQTPPPQDDESTKAMFEQLLAGQQTLTVTLNGKIDNIYTDLNDKIETLTIHVKKLDVQAAQTAETIKRQNSCLPGRTAPNQQHCNAISSHDKETAQIEAMFTKLLDGQQQLTSSLTQKIDTVYYNLNGKIEEVHNYAQKLEARISQVAESVQNQAVCRSTSPICVDRQPSRNQTEKKSQPSVDPSTTTMSVDRQTPISVDRHDPRADLPYVMIPPSVKSNDYAPKVPYPRPRRSKQEIEDEKCKAMLDKIKTKVPLSDNEDTSSLMKRLARRMVLNGLTPEEGALLTRDTSAVFSAKAPKKTKAKKEKAIVSKQSSEVIQRSLPKKLPDPGRFVLDCSISTARFSHSLCDLGSGINLMPLSVALRLRMTDFKPTNISIFLADRSRRLPEGILEDVPIKVGGCVIPTDFVVMTYASEPIDPLILGRPFLATAGAKIDVKKGTMQLDLGDVVMDFDMDKLRKAPTIDGMTFSVVTSDDIIIEYVDKLSSSEQAAKPEDSSEMCCSKHSETEIAETVCRSTHVTRVDRHHGRAEPETSKKAVSQDVLKPASPIAAPRQKAPHLPLPSPREKPRYTNSNPPPPNIINKNFKGSKTALRLTKPRDSRRGLVSSFDDVSGKRSIPPIATAHPDAILTLLGRSPAPNAYKPPWMRRHLSRRHSLPPSDPPDL